MSHGRFIPIPMAKLRLGMYVWLPCRWYQHPFPSSRFRLTHAQQLTIIRRLSLKTVYYDPTLSDGDETAFAPPLRSAPLPPAMLPSTAAPIGAQNRFSRAMETYQHTVQETERALQVAVQEDLRDAVDQARQLILQVTQHLASGALSIGMAHLMTRGNISQSAAMHALETTLLAVAVGQELSLKPDAMQELGIAALWHDLGEMFEARPGRAPVPRLTPSRQGIQRHPEYGRRLIQRIPNIPRSIDEIVYQHHEHLDGSGYPRRLQQEAIHPLARVLRVVDVYNDLLSGADPDHESTPQQVLSELYVVRKRQLWPEAVVALVRVLTIYPPGSFVQLSNGMIGLVVQIHREDPLRPLVMAHHENAAKTSTVLLDLSSEPETAIVTTLRVSNIPAAVLTRLTQQDVLDFLLQNSGVPCLLR